MDTAVDCPWCSAPVALRDEDIAITCDACGVVADLAMAESARLADAA